jgi:hypothetical protein
MDVKGTTTADTLGISRRSLLKRGAVVGGTVWAVPVVQSLSAPAFAQGVLYGGGRTDLSYIAIVYDCGSGARGLKIDVPEGCADADTTSGCDLLAGCGGTGETPDCNNGDFFGTTPSGSCADIQSATVDDNGNVTIILQPGCQIIRAAAKCGSGTGACEQTPTSSHLVVSGNAMTVTVSDNFCPNPVGS